LPSEFVGLCSVIILRMRCFPAPFPVITFTRKHCYIRRVLYFTLTSWLPSTAVSDGPRNLPLNVWCWFNFSQLFHYMLGKVSRKRPNVRPRRRWGIILKWILKTFVCRSRTELSWLRARTSDGPLWTWKWTLENAEELLISWRTLSFSRRTLLLGFSSQCHCNTYISLNKIIASLTQKFSPSEYAKWKYRIYEDIYVCIYFIYLL
jgi:hypothetical protein